MKKLILILISCISCLELANAKPHYVTIRAAEGVSEQYIANTKGELIPSSTVEFEANENTFVRFGDQVIPDEVVVLIPEVLKPNDLMETLIKIYTLRSLGARLVKVQIMGEMSNLHVVSENGETLTLDLDPLFTAAGAKIISDSRSRIALRKGKDFSHLYATKQTFIDGETHPNLTNELQNELGIPRLNENVGRDTLSTSQVILVSPSPSPVNQNLLKTLARLQELRLMGVKNIHLFTPNLPYERSDKVDQPGVAANLKLIAKLFEVSGATTITFIRAHAAQSTGFFNHRANNLSGKQLLLEKIDELKLDMVISPDAGFQKDATEYADALGLPVGVVNKQRDKLSGKTRIVGISTDRPLMGLRVIVIDDQTASGGTAISTASYLLNLGAKEVYVAFSHLTGDGSAIATSKQIKKAFILNTLPIEHLNSEKIEILSVARESSGFFQRYKTGKNYCAFSFRRSL